MNETRNAVSEQVDTRDMIVVHTALQRELRLAPDVVARTRSRRGRARAVRHLRLVLGLLEHHHAGEDRLLLPLLRGRVRPAELGHLDAGEEQHARIEEHITDAVAMVDRWAGGDLHVAPALVETLTTLHAAVEVHLRGEERDVLPLAAAHLTVAEWEAIGEAGSASVPKSALLTVFGMFMYEGDPEVLASMLATAPPPVRALVPRIAPLVHRRYCRGVYGTPRP